MSQTSFRWPLAPTHTLAQSLYEEDQILLIDLLSLQAVVQAKSFTQFFHQFSNESCLTFSMRIPSIYRRE
jgi:hypothetical protein